MFQCPGSQSHHGKYQRLLVDSQKYQMMDHAVQSTSLIPLIVVENQRYCYKKFICIYRYSEKLLTYYLLVVSS